LATALTVSWNTQSDGTLHREAIDEEKTLLLPRESRSKGIVVEFFFTPLQYQMSNVKVPGKSTN
jgi:hypothetical protein